METINKEDWNKLGKELYGKKGRNWKFICPRCKTIQCGQDLLDLDVPLNLIESAIGFSCIGRFTKEKGCDWTLGGLFQIHELEIIDEDGEKFRRFKFADEPHNKTESGRQK